ncbi:MAG TPA: zinc ribbon domain-containing protein [Gemmatimonadaceae bacterium]|jgi:putative FmdB family regulatory protein|nr:zinc ribbon domain-containing protein [Gemmatimonadaceae bacterium]
MPTYEYRCPDGHVVERRFKMSEAAGEVTCPVCGKVAVRQLSGGAGLVFKGSGFYLTDYGRNAHRGTAPESAAKEGGGESGKSNGDAKSKEGGGSDKPAAEAKSESKSPDAKPSASTSKESKPSGATGSASGPSGTKSDG